VKLYWRGELIKVHPLMAPGRRHTDPADLPAEVSIYAMRDITALQREAAAHVLLSHTRHRGLSRLPCAERLLALSSQ
jgi:hypothetical protein